MTKSHYRNYCNLKPPGPIEVRELRRSMEATDWLLTEAGMLFFHQKLLGSKEEHTLTSKLELWAHPSGKGKVLKAMKEMT